MTEREKWVHELPKVELHIHLEGAFPIKTLWLLIEKYGEGKSVGSLEKLKEKFQFRNFLHFIENWIWKDGFLREYEDYRLIAEQTAEIMARQNIVYSEMFFTPNGFLNKGLEIGRVAEAFREGFEPYRNRLEIALIADLARNMGPENGFYQLEMLKELKEYGIIGIGLGGPEKEFPPEQYAPVYEKARDYGFHTTAHAGEAAGAESIWGAIRELKAERIGHGTRAYEDPALVDYLAEHQIPVEMNPVSNVLLKIVPDLDAHPIRKYFDKGLCVFVNTDDPLFFGNTLDGEYQLLEDRFGFTRKEILETAKNAVKASWCGKDKKEKLIAEIEVYRSKENPPNPL